MPGAARGDRLRRCRSWLVAAACIAASSAAAVTLPPRPVNTVHLVKARHEGLRFEWQAVVAEGGAFVLRRSDARTAPEIVSTALPGQSTYDAALPAPAASGVYELRFRDARGTDHLLATLLVNCHALDTGQHATTFAPASRLPFVAAASAARPRLVPLEPCLAAPVARSAAPARKPSLPPPRSGATEA